MTAAAVKKPRVIGIVGISILRAIFSIYMGITAVQEISQNPDQ
jgi:hypothetical protein